MTYCQTIQLIVQVVTTIPTDRTIRIIPKVRSVALERSVLALVAQPRVCIYVYIIVGGIRARIRTHAHRRGPAHRNHRALTVKAVKRLLAAVILTLSDSTIIARILAQKIPVIIYIRSYCFNSLLQYGDIYGNI